MAELSFFLQKGEKVIKDCEYLTFSGVGYATFGGFAGGGQGGLFGGLAGGRVIKTEGSVFDAKTCHMYLTNKRLVFCAIKVGILNFKELSVGNIIAEIPLIAIEGVQSGTKLMIHTSVELAVRNNQGGIDKNVIMFAEREHKFLNFTPKRKAERDEWIQLISKARSNAVKAK